MGIVIGIDVGGSTTKIVGIKEGKIIETMLIKAADPVTSLFGALGKYTYSNNINFENIEKIMITGVGSAYVNQPLLGISTGKVDEFLANGIGGRYLTKLNNTIVVSMGTGTSLVKVENENIEHLGGIGIGGGTIVGLSKLLLDTDKIDEILELAKDGNLENVDLQIKDITKETIPNLPMDATASNFGKVKNNVAKEDLALGIVNMVLQAIGKSSIFSALNTNIRDFVMIGNLSRLPQCKTVFDFLSNMSDVNFIVPEFSEYATAIGAAMVYMENKKYNEVN